MTDGLERAAVSRQSLYPDTTYRRRGPVETECFDPAAWLAAIGYDVPWIAFDPGVVPQYRIRRGMVHDGTLAHTLILIAEALSGLLNRTSYYVPLRAELERLEQAAAGYSVQYTVGLARIVSTPNADRFFGHRQRIRVPVRMTITEREPL